MAEGDEQADDGTLPEEADPAEPAPPKEKKAAGVPMGMRVGDFIVRPTVSMATSNRHDNFRNDERPRRAEEDARAAQQSGVAAPAPFNPMQRAEYAAPPRTELDDAIDAARAQVQVDQGEAAGDVPIIFRDPVTGEPIIGA